MTADLDKHSGSSPQAEHVLVGNTLTSAGTAVLSLSFTESVIRKLTTSKPPKEDKEAYVPAILPVMTVTSPSWKQQVVHDM